MKLLVVSYKVCWESPTSPSDYVTIGGYPFQMQTLSDLFDETRLLLLLRKPPLPSGVTPLRGKNLKVCALEEPSGTDWRRKAYLIPWLVRHLPIMLREICQADAVHALVPGDIGTLGVVIALLHRKRLFVRHCGTWGHRATLADRFLMWLLPRIAGGKNIVMATGGGETPPQPDNTKIDWIFSTALTGDEVTQVPVHVHWRGGEPLVLATVGRLTAQKNAEAVILALSLIRQHYPTTTLRIVGDGPCLSDLRALADLLGQSDAITFYGNVPHDQVLTLLATSHLFVFPTRVAEGFPKAVLEAMACGLPVIAPRVSVIPYLIGTRNGLLLDSTSSTDVADAVLKLIADDQNLQEISTSAQLAAQQYTLERWRQTVHQRLAASWGSLSSVGK
jgi:glycosyltransferase involved in cell wall biosynthesis